MNGKATAKPLDPESALATSLHARYGTTEEARALIAAALVFWRRGQEATAILEAEGLTIKTRGGVWKHPLLATERETRLGFAQLLRILDERTRRQKIGAPTKRERMAAPTATAATRRYLRRAQ